MSVECEAAFRRRLAEHRWAYLRTTPRSGEWNMGLDRRLLEQAAADQVGPTLRLYTWKPAAVSLGRFQSEDDVDLEAARDRGIDVVRRPTGGRAVLHQHELTYSLVLPPEVVGGAGVRTSYAVLSRALNAALGLVLSRNGVPAGVCASGGPHTTPIATGRAVNCFALAAECDTLVEGRKLVGSAQVRRGGALLQHGSVLLDAEPDAWEALFGETGRLVTLRELWATSGRPWAYQQAEDEVAGAVHTAFCGREAWKESPDAHCSAT